MDSIERATDLIRRGQLETALEFIRSSLRNETGEGDGVSEYGLRLLLADVYFGRDQYEKAIAAYDVAGPADSLPLLAQARLAYSCLRTRRRNRAMAILCTLANKPAQLTRSELELAVETALRMNALAIAETTSAEGRRRYPQIAIFWFAAGEIHRIRGVSEPAEMYYHQAHGLAPDCMRYRIALGRQQLAVGDLEAASQTIEVDVDEVTCLANLLRLQKLYSELDDYSGILACESALNRWYFQNTSGFGFDEFD